MVFGRREFLVIALLVTIGNEGCRGQSDKSSSNDVDNRVDLVPTYRSKLEIFLQGLLSIVPGGSSSSGTSGTDGGIVGLIGSFIPTSIKKITAPVETATTRGFSEVLNLFEKNVLAIYPGTRWCGGGNISNSEEDVGLFKHTDACCRAHDNCAAIIDAGKSRGPLINNGIFTRSACVCDQEFYSCLKNVGSLISLKIGKTYFNVLKPQCFAYDYPIKSCQEYAYYGILHRKCIKYDFDYSKTKILEWFDSPNF